MAEWLGLQLNSFVSLWQQSYMQSKAHSFWRLLLDFQMVYWWRRMAAGNIVECKYRLRGSQKCIASEKCDLTNRCAQFVHSAKDRRSKCDITAWRVTSMDGTVCMVTLHGNVACASICDNCCGCYATYIIACMSQLRPGDQFNPIQQIRSMHLIKALPIHRPSRSRFWDQ